MFCKNCGTKIDDALFCPQCGGKIEKDETTLENGVVAAKHPKSLSFIMQVILSVSAIALLFFKKYAWCYEKTPITGANTYYQSYWNFADSSIWGLTAIFLMITPIIFSVIYFLANKKALVFVSMGCSIATLLYMIFSSVYLAELFRVSDKIVKHVYFGTMKYEYDFLSFSYVFYVILGILVFSIVISIFDAINKPLIKVKNK